MLMNDMRLFIFSDLWGVLSTKEALAVYIIVLLATVVFLVIAVLVSSHSSPRVVSVIGAGGESEGASQSKKPESDDRQNGQETEAGEDGELPDSNRTGDNPRFEELTRIDRTMVDYRAPAFDETIGLAELCERFRNFAAYRLHLYYSIDDIRRFIASLGVSPIIIMQGMSGTGKTSLASAFGNFVQHDSTIIPIQPMWKERSDMIGYFNEFTERFNEMTLLKNLYEANYTREIYVTVLDEMNIARVEYYFAEMLSILEMPREEDWKVDIVTSVWDNDPCLINSGTVQITNNIWFVGTINNDDSTFAVADKVYDRAIPIDLDSRADAFECESTPPIFVSTDRLIELFNEAKEQYPISQEMLDKLEVLNAYLIKNFRLAFGNRIMKQIKDYVPCFIGCGGTEIQAVDFIVAKKVLRKFESLSLGFMREELTKFSAYLDKLFGKNTMVICKEYIEQLKKNM